MAAMLRDFVVVIVIVRTRPRGIPLAMITMSKSTAELPSASLSKRGLVHNHSYENELNLHVNDISFTYERIGTKTRFEKEAKGNAEMDYFFPIWVWRSPWDSAKDIKY